MEQFPTGNNPENTNQQPTGADILADMPSFEEMRRQNAIPEGVRDEQDYREYQAEQQARAAEQSKADAEFIEHSNKYIAEISKIENPQDKYMAIASLRYMTDVKRNKSRQNNTENAQDVMLEFFNRNDKNKTVRDFIANKVNTLIENGASEEEIKHYNLPIEYAEYMERIEEGARIQAINDSDSETAEKTLEDLLAGKNLGDLVDFGFESFGRRYTELLEINSPFTAEPNDFIERPASDRGIIVSMAEDLINRIHDDDPNTTEQRYYKNKLTVLGQLYNGKNFDTQLRHIKGYLIRSVAEDIHDGKEQTDIGHVVRTTAILEMSSEFSLKQKRYGYFIEGLSRGQQILDNFKNNQEA